ncbi:LysR substrate-binding domain-containing protein [Qingshengfaniella alkalisoli]|uniref:LysR family transcriptional regulator n=1 Tax=Qingshengfaniella alkalisoli TaxID=2599296 RepID=A0A5B8J494_9RHOB|nr:LysR substrate-binding domain-containing protein [Qingshengfaniella alkalisoli]QDY69090.1 LysR family transcriptional regulator [Qingshengfaniella alkalisoli]
MHRGIKLRHIRCFLGVAQEGTVSAAAERMGVSQPAMSKTLSDLELMLGQPLFTRKGRRTILTPAGETFRRHALQAVQSLESGAAAMRTAGGGSRIRVGLLPTAATRFFPEVALEFAGLYPECTVSVTTGPNQYLLDLLRSRRIDLMVGRMPQPREMPGLGFDYLYDETVVVAVRPDHPRQSEPITTLARELPLILPTQHALIRRTVDDYLVSIGVTEPRVWLETISLAFGRGALLRSDALWFISHGVILDELKMGVLHTLNTDARFMTGAVGLTRSQSLQMTDEISTMKDMMHRRANTGG